MRRDTIRQILIDISHGFQLYRGDMIHAPHNRWWKFDRRRDEKAARQLVMRLRTYADRLERWLDGDART